MWGERSKVVVETFAKMMGGKSQFRWLGHSGMAEMLVVLA